MRGANILLTGVTGRVGEAVAKELSTQGMPRPLGLVRKKTPLSSADESQSPLDYIPVLGDLADATSLAQSLREVDRALLVTNIHPDQCRLQGNFIDAAVTASQPIHLVKLSGLGSRLNSEVDSGRWHAETEAYARTRGLSAHFLHPYFFMQNFAFSIEQVRRTGTLTSGVDGDTPIAMVDLRDIAAVATCLLLDPTQSSVDLLPLTSARTYTHNQVASLLSQQLNQEIVYKVQAERDLRRALNTAGQPDWHIDIIVQFNTAFDAGLAAKPSPYVGQILARAPRTLEDYLVELSRDTTSVTGRNPFPNA